MPLFPVNPIIESDKIFFSPAQLKSEAFCEPFFDGNTKATATTEKINLDTCQQPVHIIPLKAFIFHISHCGSTLLSQSLSTINSYRVISEAEIINAIFLAKVFNNGSDQICISRLRIAINLLLQPIYHTEESAFIKFTSWNIFHADLIRQAFPHVPIIYVHREPLEVISSLKKQLNGFAQWNKHLAPVLAAHYLEKTFDQIKKLTTDEYLGQMLLLHMHHALNSLPNTTSRFFIFPDWIQGFPDNIFPSSARLTLIRQKMTQRLSFNSKKPSEKFTVLAGVKEKTLLSSSLHKNLLHLHQRILERSSA